MKKKHKKKIKASKELIPKISYSSAVKDTISQKKSELVEELTLIEIVKTRNFKDVQKYIFTENIGIIASKSNVKFWSEFLEYFPDLTQRARIAENIIDKISLHENSLSVMRSSFISQNIENNRINHLRAETLLVQGENILNIILQDKTAPTTFSAARQGVEIIESSYWLYQSLLNSVTKSFTYKFFHSTPHLLNCDGNMTL